MEKNILTKFEHYYPYDKDRISTESKMELLTSYSRIYSFQILADVEENTLKGWIVLVLVSQNDSYNTISNVELISSLIDAEIEANTPKKVLVKFKQPSLEMILQLYEPLVNKLAQIEHLHWSKLEFDDLKQMCRLCICMLYKQGYYVHKNLIKTTFIRYVLSELRLHGDEYDAIPMHKLNKDEQEYIDSIEDESVEEEFESIISSPQDYVDDRKQTVINIIGQRQYDQIVREYRTKTTTNSTAKLVCKLKQQLSEVK